MNQPIEIFCCAAPTDQPLLEKLLLHLKLKQQQGIIMFWDRAHLAAGTDVDEEIRQHIDRARIFLLLISSDFLADNYCYEQVLRSALEKHIQGKALNIPVIVRPVSWQDVSVLNRIQVLPKNGFPLSGQPDLEAALWEVAREIDTAIQKLRGAPAGFNPVPVSNRPSGSTFSPPAGSGPSHGVFSPGPPPLSRNQSGSGPSHKVFPAGSPPFAGNPFPADARPISSPTRNPKDRSGIWLIFLAVLILVGGSAFVFYEQGSNKQGNTNTPNLTSTQSVSTNSATSITSSQNTPTAGSNGLSSAVTTPQLPFNMACGTCVYKQLSVTLSKIELNTPAQSMRWILTFLNNGSSCTPNYDTISISDQNGTSYDSAGQATSGASFTIAQGQALQQTAVFSVFPASGAQYTLTLELNIGNCANGFLNSYQTLNVTFA